MKERLNTTVCSIMYSSAKVSRACNVFWFMSWALSFASAFFSYVALRLPFRLFSRRWSSPSLDRTASFSVASAAVEVTGCGCRRGAQGIVRHGTSEISFTVLDDLNPCPRSNFGCYLIVFGRDRSS